RATQQQEEEPGERDREQQPAHTGNVARAGLHQRLTVDRVPKTLGWMHRAVAACVTLLLVGGLARAQDGGVTPAAPVATPAAAAPPAKVATKKRRKPKRPPPAPPPAAELYALNTRETFMLRPDPKGRFTKAVLRGWNHFLRCHHTGRTHAMSTRLAQLIYQVA